MTDDHFLRNLFLWHELNVYSRENKKCETYITKAEWYYDSNDKAAVIRHCLLTDLEEKTFLRKMSHHCCGTITSPAPGLSQKKPGQICISYYIFYCGGLESNGEDFLEIYY